MLNEGDIGMKVQNLDQRRWLVLVSSCLANLCIGSLYAWSVFASPLAEKLGGGLTAADLGIVFTVANCVGPITMISGGFINDRLGPRWVIFAGGALFGAGMLLSGFAGSVTLLLVTYGLGCGLGNGLAYGCTISNSVKFFPDKRGLIGGIATATFGLSSVLIPPVANALIQTGGVSQAFVILGVAFLVIVCVCAMFIIKCPEGYCPAGYVPQKSARGSGSAVQDKNWKGMLSDPIFYLMIAMMLCGAFSGLMITSQASPMAQSITGMSVTAAAAAVSVLALFNAAGRIVAGFLSDRFGRVTVLIGAFVLELAGLAVLLTTGAGGELQFIAGVSVMGICFGSLMGVYPGFTADKFGARYNSVNYGIMFIGFATAGYFGPLAVRSVLGATGAYTGTFYIAGALACLGIILAFVYRGVTKKAGEKSKPSA